MADFTIKRGDTRPILLAQLEDNDVPIDLTTATQVKLYIKPQQGSSTTVNQAMTFVDRPNGEVSYTWTTVDTATVGLYRIEFEITWSGGGVQTVPNGPPPGHSEPYYTMEITQDLI